MENHHAFVVYSEADVSEMYREQSTDVLHIVRDRLSIDDARELSLQAQQTPFQSSKRVFVIVCTAIATEAQNALLKLFEEPPSHALFYLVVPKTAVLLPTLQSRLMLLESVASSSETDSDFIEFQKASYADRMSSIAAQTKDKNAAWIEGVVFGCEKVAEESKNMSLMESVVFVRRYIQTKGASAKMLLEELALQLPQK